MERSEYQLMKRDQDCHWLSLGRRRIIQNVIESQIDLSRRLKIADVGCGYGSNISFLLQYGSVTGLEYNEDCLVYLHEKFRGSAETIRLKIPDELDRKFDLLVLSDVFEHIQDGAEAIQWFYEHLEERGYLLILVPAHPVLWTQMDEVVHHYHRYTKKTLFPLLQQRFEIVFSSYYNLILSPLKLALVAFDRVQRLLTPRASKRSFNEIPPGPINRLFQFILFGEAALLKRKISLPLGVNLMVLARRRVF